MGLAAAPGADGNHPALNSLQRQYLERLGIPCFLGGMARGLLGDLPGQLAGTQHVQRPGPVDRLGDPGRLGQVQVPQPGRGLGMDL